MWQDVIKWLWRFLFLRSFKIHVRRGGIFVDIVCQKKAKNESHLHLSVWTLYVCSGLFFKQSSNTKGTQLLFEHLRLESFVLNRSTCFLCFSFLCWLLSLWMRTYVLLCSALISVILHSPSILTPDVQFKFKPISR